MSKLSNKMANLHIMSNNKTNSMNSTTRAKKGQSEIAKRLFHPLSIITAWYFLVSKLSDL